MDVLSFPGSPGARLICHTLGECSNKVVERKLGALTFTMVRLAAYGGPDSNIDGV